MPVGDPRGVAHDARDHEDAKDQEDEDCSHLDDGEPELSLAIGPRGQHVQQEQQGQEPG